MNTLSIIALCSAVLTIVCKYKESNLIWLFKPMTMIFIILIAAFFGESIGAYRWLIVTGLLFSLIGDVVLIEDKKYFVYGLGSFLIAHLFFIPAFGIAAGKFHAASLLAYVAGIVGYMVIRKGIPEKLAAPVVFYNLVISTMLCAALNLWLANQSENAAFALAGAISFVVSDSILAFNKFRASFKAAHILILATYFLAQWLIALSV